MGSGPTTDPTELAGPGALSPLSNPDPANHCSSCEHKTKAGAPEWSSGLFLAKPPPWLRPRCCSLRFAPGHLRGGRVPLRSAGRGPFPSKHLGLVLELGPAGSARATARPQRRQARGFRERGGACAKHNLIARPWCARYRSSARNRERPIYLAIPAGSDIYPSSSFTKSAHRSPIMMLGALVLPLTRRGITLASATHRPLIPRTLSLGSTTLSSSAPIRQVPTGW